MNTIAAIITGTSFFLLGLFILLNLVEVVKFLEAVYEEGRKNYDRKYSNVSLFKKVLAFLFLRFSAYYHDENSTKSLSLFFAVCSMILGMVIVLLGLNYKP